MKTKIDHALRDLEAKHGFHILHACESGSRAWGFASADSDYDVRFIYAWPQERYLGIFDPPHTIDCGIDENLLDIIGWDLRKALPLFRKANGSLFEWLHGPIVYREESEVMQEWRSLVPDYFVPRPSASHYLGLSTKIRTEMAEKGKVTAKGYLYVLRSLLAAGYVVAKSSPIPVVFGELRASMEIPSQVNRQIDEMIEDKSHGAEADSMGQNEVLDHFIESESERLRPLVKELPSEPGGLERLDAFFRSVISRT